MAGFSNYLEAAVLNATLRNTTYTSPATVYLSLHSADPGDTGANELTATNGYARQAVAFNAPSAGVCLNTDEETFTASGGNWTAATHFAIWDAASAGNCLYSGTLDTSRTILDGASGVFAAGSISVTLA